MNVAMLREKSVTLQIKEEENKMQRERERELVKLINVENEN